jgi:hypothetical protein
MRDLLLIIPSRSRHERIITFKEYFDKNSVNTDLCLGLDDDQYDLYPKFNDVVYDINPNVELGPKLNIISAKYCNDYKYVGFLGDDHLVKTYAWDQKLMDSIAGIKNGMAYGNDLLQGQALPTAIIMDSNIIKTLGYMSPPGLEHLYIDNFWLNLGQRLGTIKYCPDVIIEHMHYSTGKAEIDELYVASTNLNDYDFAAYQSYLQKHFENDLKKFV